MFTGRAGVEKSSLVIGILSMTKVNRKSGKEVHSTSSIRNHGQLKYIILLAVTADLLPLRHLEFRSGGVPDATVSAREML